MHRNVCTTPCVVVVDHSTGDELFTVFAFRSRLLFEWDRRMGNLEHQKAVVESTSMVGTMLAMNLRKTTK